MKKVANPLPLSSGVKKWLTPKPLKWWIVRHGKNKNVDGNLNDVCSLLVRKQSEHVKAYEDGIWQQQYIAGVCLFVCVCVIV